MSESELVASGFNEEVSGTVCRSTRTLPPASMSRIFQLVGLMVLSMLTACSRVEPLSLPEANSILSIEGQISNSYDSNTATYRDSVKVTDAERIREILCFLVGMNNDMEIPFGTFPTPTHTIILNDAAGRNVVVFVGLGWVGGRNNVSGDAGKNRLRYISDAQRAALLRLVGLKDYRFQV